MMSCATPTDTTVTPKSNESDTFVMVAACSPINELGRHVTISWPNIREYPHKVSPDMQ